MAGRAIPTDACRPISAEAESRVFGRLRGLLAWHTLGTMFTTARLRMVLVTLLTLVFWGSLYGLFLEGFAFLETIHADVISLLFNAFFSSLLVMLVFSAGILL